MEKLKAASYIYRDSWKLGQEIKVVCSVHFQTNLCGLLIFKSALQKKIRGNDVCMAYYWSDGSHNLYKFELSAKKLAVLKE